MRTDNKARTLRTLVNPELLALGMANQFWANYVEELHVCEPGGAGCSLALDLDELEVEMDQFAKKGMRKARRLHAQLEEVAKDDGPLGQLLGGALGHGKRELLEHTLDENTWGMFRAYVLAYARAVLNARQ